MGDFLRTFEMSQAEQLGQIAWRGLAVDHLRTTLPAAEVAAISGSLPDFRSAALGLRPPSDHVRVSEATRQAQMEFHWTAFEGLLKGRPSLPVSVLGGLATHSTANRDLRYQLRPRASAGDPHKSYMREHMLGGQSTRSDTYDAIFANLRARSFRYGLPFAVGSLRRRWERNHPGESFFPENYAEDYRNNATVFARARNGVASVLGRPLVVLADVLRAE